MIPDSVLRKIVCRIHNLPELAGCLIGFHGNRGCRTIGFPSCVTTNSENIAVVVEELVLAGRVSATGSLVSMRASSVVARQVATNRTRLGPELIGAGVSCGLTVLSALGVAVGTASEVPTGGASTFLLIASWSGLATGAIQCANGVVRVGAVFADLDGNTLDRWDNNQVYSVSILLVDAIGIAGAVGSLPYAVRNLWNVVSRMRAFSAAKLSFEVLRRMNRLERLRAISKVFTSAARTPEGAAALVSAAREARIGARTLQRSSGLSVNHASTLLRIINDETVHRLHASLRDVLGTAAGVAVSASSPDTTGSGSGSVNWIIHLLDAGKPNI